jgi:hypothetical protein
VHAVGLGAVPALEGAASVSRIAPANSSPTRDMHHKWSAPIPE